MEDMDNIVDSKATHYFDMGYVGPPPKKISMMNLCKEIYKELYDSIIKILEDKEKDKDKDKYINNVRNKLFDLVDKVIKGENNRRDAYFDISICLNNINNEDIQKEIFKYIYSGIDKDTINQQFVHIKDGLIKKIQKQLYYDLSLYPNDRIEEKYEKLKLLKLLYKYEKIQKFKIIDIIKKPSVENIYNIETNNTSENTTVHNITSYSDFGIIIDEIKHEILKEIPKSDEFINNIKINIIKALDAWEHVVKILRSLIMVHANTSNEVNYLDNLMEFEDNLKVLVRLIINEYKNAVKIKKEHIVNKTMKYDPSLASSFYLQIVLSDIRGRELDFCKMRKFINIENKVNDEYISKIKDKFNLLIPLKDIDAYVKKNSKIIKQFIFYSDVLDSNNKINFSTHLKHVKSMIRLLKEYGNINFEKGVSFPHLIACFQESISYKNIIVKYGYYRETEKTKLTSILKRLYKNEQSNSNNKKVHEFFKMLIFQNICNRFLINIGQYRQAKLMFNIEKYIDAIINYIFKFIDIEKLVSKSEFYIKTIDNIIYSNNYVDSYFKILNTMLKDAINYEITWNKKIYCQVKKMAGATNIDKLASLIISFYNNKQFLKTTSLILNNETTLILSMNYDKNIIEITSIINIVKKKDLQKTFCK